MNRGIWWNRRCIWNREVGITVLEMDDGCIGCEQDELKPCKGNISCTSYSRTFGYGKLRTSTWSTLRTMARTPQSTLTCTMRSSEHAAHRLLMHSGHTSHFWLKVSPCVSFHVIHACALVPCSLSVSPHPSFYFLVLFLFSALPDVQLGA